MCVKIGGSSQRMNKGGWLKRKRSGEQEDVNKKRRNNPEGGFKNFMNGQFHLPLYRNEGPESISIYLPVGKDFGETEKVLIRLKTASKKIEEQLLSAGLGTRKVQNVLGEIKRIIEGVDLARYQPGGLAFFMAGDFHLTIQLPVQFDTLVTVRNGFELRPIFNVFQNNREYYIVVLSQENARLFKADKFAIEEIPLSSDTPTSLEEAMRHDDPEKQLQHQTVSGVSGGANPIFHGHSEKDNKNNNLKRFFGLFDDGVREAIEQNELPVVLAGLDMYQPIYSQKSGLNNILPSGVERNVDSLSPKEIQKLAWEVVNSELASLDEVALETYHNLLKDQRTTCNLSRIALASANGKVNTLIAKKTGTAWGIVNPEENSVQIRLAGDRQPHDVELVNSCIKQTILNGGQVYVLEPGRMPVEDTPVCAILRY
jgi:hypothetical protein